MATPTKTEMRTTIETDLGAFVLRRRTAGDELEILRRQSALMATAEPSDLLVNFSYVLAALEVLVEKAPDGVVLVECDRDDLNALWGKYAEWLQSFRQPAASGAA